MRGERRKKREQWGEGTLGTQVSRRRNMPFEMEVTPCSRNQTLSKHFLFLLVSVYVVGLPL